MHSVLETIPVYVGYDGQAEPVAYHVFCQSVISRASQPISFHPLALNMIKGYRETHTDGSNAFIYSRFLVPYLEGYKGWAIFCDGDMICNADIAELWAMRDPYKAVQVVKHDYKTKHPVKYLGAKNEDYPRKNWSSVMLINCSHFAWRTITPEFVQNATGSSYLHRFEFIADDRIGELPMEWNWLVEEYEHNDHAKLYHYTIGTPCFAEFSRCDHAGLWHKEHMKANNHKQLFRVSNFPLIGAR